MEWVWNGMVIKTGWYAVVCFLDCNLLKNTHIAPKTAKNTKSRVLPDPFWGLILPILGLLTIQIAENTPFWLKTRFHNPLQLNKVVLFLQGVSIPSVECAKTIKNP